MTLFLSAGEQSGDLLGAELAAALLRQDPHLKLTGVGGEKMKNAKVELISSMERLHAMGFQEIPFALPRLYNALKDFRDFILTTNPKAVVTIDFPDFHFFLAKMLKKASYPGRLIHFVSPSIWAWRKGRIHTLEKNYDLLLAILPFEKALYEMSSLNVSYVGHPLTKKIKEEPLHDREELLALFPGSRKGVIEKNLPLQLKVASLFLKKHPSHRLAVSVARESLRKPIEEGLSKYSLRAELVSERENYSLMQRAKAALASSGTINLELALCETPTVVTYKVSLLNGMIARLCFGIHLEHYTLPNILLKERLFPEFIHTHINPNEVANALDNVLRDQETISKKCQKMRELLGDKDAAEEAALAILKIV